MPQLKSLNRTGFTLIELLIVVAIIAILAAIAVPNFLEAQTRAKVSRAYNDMRCTATGLESYYVDNNKYPPHYNIGSSYYLFVPWALTSPISYVSKDCLFDIFTKTSEPPNIGITGDADPDFYRRLLYQNTLYWKALKDQGISFILVADGQPVESHTYDKVGGWSLTSKGPDLRYGPVIPQRGTLQRLQVLYDPTNGTTSLGDLVRSQKDTVGRGADQAGGNL